MTTMARADRLEGRLLELVAVAVAAGYTSQVCELAGYRWSSRLAGASGWVDADLDWTGALTLTVCRHGDAWHFQIGPGAPTDAVRRLLRAAAREVQRP